MRALIDRLEQTESRVSAMPREEALVLLDELLAGLRAAMTAPNAESHRLFASARKTLHGLPLDILSESRVEGLLLSAQFAYISGQPFSGLEPASIAVRHDGGNTDGRGHPLRGGAGNSHRSGVQVGAGFGDASGAGGHSVRRYFPTGGVDVKHYLGIYT